MKRTLVIAVAFGAGLALVSVSGVALLSWWSSRPILWNDSAVTALFDTVDTEGPEKKLVFFYVLSNNTDRDFRIDSDAEVRLMGRLQRQAALTTEYSKEFLTDEFPLFVPAKQRTRLAVHPGYPYRGSVVLSQGTSKADRVRDKEAVASFVREELSNLGGFVLFHEPTHYQIELPSGWKK